MSSLNVNQMETLTQQDVKTQKGLSQYFIRQGVIFHEKSGQKGLETYFVFIMEHQKFIRNDQGKKDIILEILKQCNLI